MVSAARGTGKVTDLKPQFMSVSLESTIQSFGSDMTSLGMMAQDFVTEKRFPAALLMIKVDGRNSGSLDPTPVPMVLSVLDDLTDEAKAASAGLNPNLARLSALQRVQAFDERKVELLRKSGKFDITQFKNQEGTFVSNKI